MKDDELARRVWKERRDSFIGKRIGHLPDRLVVIKDARRALLELTKLARTDRPDQCRDRADPQHRDHDPDVDQCVGHEDYWVTCSYLSGIR